MKLTPGLILEAYAQGIFPMGEPNGALSWYSPDPRAVFPLDAFHVPKTLAKTIRQNKFEVKYSAAFEQVLRGCASRDETWITPSIHRSYLALHLAGQAHSVEAWLDGELVGGLYGVVLGSAFMGESMFSRATDASKVCLVALVARLNQRGFTLLDSQFPTPHLQRFGQALIPRSEYLARLSDAMGRSPSFL